jgi:hypothetical protein
MKKIAPKEKVVELVKKVLRERIKVESQEELCKLVLRELKKEDKNYTLSPIRVKRIALEISEIEVKAKTKRKFGLLKIEKCPICDSPIEPIKVKNLLNKEIVIGYRCTNCAYESDLEAFVPMKYIFLIKQEEKK